MEILLLVEVPGIGNQYSICVIPESSALDLLANRVAVAATPTVRKRFFDQIRRAARIQFPKKK